MQRLVLAVILVVALVVVLAVAVTSIRRALAGRGPEPGAVTVADRDTGLQKIAYALLIGLILYVSFAGPS